MAGTPARPAARTPGARGRREHRLNAGTGGACRLPASRRPPRGRVERGAERRGARKREARARFVESEEECGVAVEQWRTIQQVVVILAREGEVPGKMISTIMRRKETEIKSDILQFLKAVLALI